MPGILIGIAMMAGMLVIQLLPVQPWWRVLLAAIYGAAAGWGIMRWKNQEPRAR